MIKKKEGTVVATFSISSSIKKKMEVFHQVNWSEVARKAFSEKIKELESQEEKEISELIQTSKRGKKE